MNRSAALCLMLAAPAATAQTAEEMQAAATNMWVATQICIDNANAPMDLVRSFAGSGFEVAPVSPDQSMTFNAFGVQGRVAPGDINPCAVHSTLVSLESLETAIYTVSQAVYPGAVEGPPSQLFRAACRMMDIILDGQRHRLEFVADIESRACVGDGSGIVLQAPEAVVGTPAASALAESASQVALSEMRAAMEICLRFNHRSFAGVLPAFAEAGYTATIEDFGGGPENVLHWMQRPGQSTATAVIAAPGVMSCRIESTEVGASDVLAFLPGALNAIHPDVYTYGSMEGGEPVVPVQDTFNWSPCTGYIGWFGQNPSIITVATAGNGPSCQDDGTAQIIIDN